MVPADKLPHSQIARFESSLERDFFVLLEFNPDVQRWDPQPVRLRVGETGSYYTPDVLVSVQKKRGRQRTKQTEAAQEGAAKPSVRKQEVDSDWGDDEVEPFAISGGD